MLTYSQVAEGGSGAPGDTGRNPARQDMGRGRGRLEEDDEVDVEGIEKPGLNPLPPAAPAVVVVVATNAPALCSPLNSMLTYSPGLLGSGGSGLSRTRGRVLALDTSTNRLTGRFRCPGPCCFSPAAPLLWPW